MKLTKTQIEILEHRLSSDCIAACLADTEELGINMAEALDAVASVTELVARGVLPFEGLGRVEMEVVIDCLDGSTFFAGSEDAIRDGFTTRGKVLAQHKAAIALENAVSAAAGRPVECVRF